MHSEEHDPYLQVEALDEALTTAQAEIEALRKEVEALRARLVGISNADPEITAEQLRLAARITAEHFAALSGSQT